MPSVIISWSIEFLLLFFPTLILAIPIIIELNLVITLLMLQQAVNSIVLPRQQCIPCTANWN